MGDIPLRYSMWGSYGGTGARMARKTHTKYAEQ